MTKGQERAEDGARAEVLRHWHKEAARWYAFKEAVAAFRDKADELGVYGDAVWAAIGELEATAANKAAQAWSAKKRAEEDDREEKAARKRRAQLRAENEKAIRDEKARRATAGADPNDNPDPSDNPADAAPQTE